MGRLAVWLLFLLSSAGMVALIFALAHARLLVAAATIVAVAVVIALELDRRR